MYVYNYSVLSLTQWPFYIFMPPLEEKGAYCLADIGRLVCPSFHCDLDCENCFQLITRECLLHSHQNSWDHDKNMAPVYVWLLGQSSRSL